MAGQATLTVQSDTQGTPVYTLPAVGPDTPAGSLPVTLDTAVETAVGTSGTKAVTIQGAAAGVPVPMSATIFGAAGDATVQDPSVPGAVITFVSLLKGSTANALALLSRFPASLGAKLGSASLSVVPASDAVFPLGAGEAHVGAIGGEGAHPTATPTATALTYASGKCIGGLNDLTGFLRVAGKGALIQSATMRSKVAQSAQIDLVIFRDVPSVTTGLADGVAFAVDPGDIAKVSKVIKFASWDSVGTACLCTLDGIGKYMALASGTGAKCILVARGAVSLSTASDLTLSLGLVQD